MMMSCTDVVWDVNDLTGATVRQHGKSCRRHSEIVDPNGLACSTMVCTIRSLAGPPSSTSAGECQILASLRID